MSLNFSSPATFTAITRWGRLKCRLGFHDLEHGATANIFVPAASRCRRCWRCEAFNAGGWVEVWYQPPAEVMREKIEHVNECVRGMAEGVSTENVSDRVARALVEVVTMRPRV